MVMIVAYPVNLVKQEDGTYLVRFPDIPEALTDGKTKAFAVREAVDCLIAALGGYINEGRDIPLPSTPAAGQSTVVLPPLIAAKVALYQAMKDASLRPGELGRRLNVRARVARQMVDLDYPSPIAQIDAALALLGKQLVVEVRDTA